MSSTVWELKKALDKLKLHCTSVLREDNFREVLLEILKLEYQSEVSSIKKNRTVTKVSTKRRKDKNGAWALIGCRCKLNVVVGSHVKLTDSKTKALVDSDALVGYLSENDVEIKFPATGLPDMVDVCVLPNKKDYERLANIVKLAGTLLGQEFCLTRLVTPFVDEETLQRTTAACDCESYARSDEQCKAVRRILSGTRRVMLLDGPSKSRSITIEAVVRVLLKIHQSKRVLIVAPSNKTADRLVELIAACCELTTQDLLRVQAKHRQKDSVSDLAFHFSVGEGITQLNGSEFPFRHVTAEEFNTARVVVATLSTAAASFERVFNYGHANLDGFDLVIVNEAAQCTEVHLLGAMAYLKKGSSRLLLAGDLRQHGPTVRTQESSGGIHYDRSPMERLLKSTWFEDDIIVYLTKTYDIHDHVSYNNHHFHPRAATTIHSVPKQSVQKPKKLGVVHLPTNGMMTCTSQQSDTTHKPTFLDVARKHSLKHTTHVLSKMSANHYTLMKKV